MAPRPIFYDTETTGLSAQTDRIIEIAAFDPTLNLTFVHFVNPGMPIPKESINICGITDAMVADAPSFAEVGQKFIDFCSGEVILIAHNNDAFDIHFLRQEFQRNALPFPDWKFFDTLKWARRYRKDLPKHSLQFLREMYGIAANNAHRALDDVVVLYQIFNEMCDDLPIETAHKLLYEANGTQKNSTNGNTMPFGKHQGMVLDQVPKHYLKWLKTSGALDKPENASLLENLTKLQLL